MSLVRRGDQSIEKYEPEVGLKRIAVAEAAEKHYRRAKDATRLCEAIELKLSEQRKYILWWDGHGLDKPGRPPKSSPESEDSGVDSGVGYQTRHVWRVRLKTDDAFDETLATAQARGVAMCEFRKGQTDQKGASGTGEFEWYTPAEYIEAARFVLGTIDLDPASSAHAQEWIRATRYFTKAEDGLSQDWTGRVWLNPPYMQPDIALFVGKLCGEVEAARTREAILLTHNYTDTAWFHRAAGTCAAICFTRGRIAFVNADGEAAAPTQGQAFFYFGQDINRFETIFAPLGFVVVPR